MIDPVTEMCLCLDWMGYPDIATSIAHGQTVRIRCAELPWIEVHWYPGRVTHLWARYTLDNGEFFWAAGPVWMFLAHYLEINGIQATKAKLDEIIGDMRRLNTTSLTTTDYCLCSNNLKLPPDQPPTLKFTVAADELPLGVLGNLPFLPCC